MGINSKIRIRRKNTLDILIWLIVFVPFLLGTLNELLGLPYAIRYTLDVVWVLEFVALLQFYRFTNCKKKNDLVIWICLFFLYTLMAYIPQYQSVQYYVWGIRNNMRFYIAFFTFVVFLKYRDIHIFLRSFDCLFWVNVLVSFVQYYVYQIRRDQLGGIFGSQGGNGFTNIFFLIVLSKSIIMYLEKKENMWTCISKCIAAIIIAAMAEIKFFFVELILIIILGVVFTNFTWRKLWILLGGFSAVLIGTGLLTSIFPSWGSWFSIEWFLDAALSSAGYTGSGDLNRLNAIPQINELWLKNWGQRMFGLGLGNCDTASFDFLNTPFFREHGAMHYSWISYAMMYLECGWIGLFFYFGFFVLVYFQTRKIEKYCDGTARAYCRMARIIAVLCMIVSVYNSSLRAESGYMAYFVLAIPFVYNREMLNTRIISVR